VSSSLNSMLSVAMMSSKGPSAQSFQSELVSCSRFSNAVTPFASNSLS
jgi:hypothetical protein